MAETSSSDNPVDLAALKSEKMLQVWDIIRMAQQAKPTELLAIKAGLDAAFGDDWRDFKPSKFLCDQDDQDRMLAKQNK